MADLPPELLILGPLALAAGLDLYLTLLALGAASTAPWWDHPLPGALGDIDEPLIMIVVGAFYVAELAAERFPTSSLVWNAAHALIRPLSGGLLAALLLHGQAPALMLVGAVAGGAVTSLAHAVRTGGTMLRWLEPTPKAGPLMVSLLEDAVVLGLVAASLDAPFVALAAAALVVGIGVPRSRSHVRLFLFATRLACSRAFQALRQRSWVSGERLPAGVRGALASDVLAPGGGLRGAPAGALRVPGLPLFATGWVVIRGGTPVFVHRRGLRERRLVDLGGLDAVRVLEHPFARALDFRPSGGQGARLFFFVSGPSPEGLAAEFPLTEVENTPASRIPDAAEKNL